MVNFDNFNSLGKVSIVENDFDPCVYPLEFDAIWQQMEHINGEYLHISGVHKQNPRIGEYSVKIFPKGRTRP